VVPYACCGSADARRVPGGDDTEGEVVQGEVAFGGDREPGFEGGHGGGELGSRREKE
jgi:hypothetical protein